MVGKTHFWLPDDDLGFQEAHLTIDNHLTPELGHDDAYIRFLEEERLFTFNAEMWADNKVGLEPDNLPDNALKVNWTGDRACDLLDDLASDPDTSFFLYVSFVEPHGPGSVKQELWDDFANRDLREMIPVGENIPETQQRALDMWDASVEDRLRYRSGVYASIHLMDANVGKILDHLDSLDLRDSTIILFLSDHGDLMYDHGCIEKTFLYEPAINIPWIMAGADIPQGETRSHFVSQIDLVPTVLDVCGIDEIPAHVEGRSVVPLLNDVAVPWRDAVFCEVEQRVHLRHLVKSSIAKMIRRDKWKYIYTLVNGDRVEEELYNLDNDPDEQHNLVGDQDQHSRIVELRSEILNWLMRGEVNRLQPAPENHYPIPKVDDHVFF